MAPSQVVSLLVTFAKSIALKHYSWLQRYEVLIQILKYLTYPVVYMRIIALQRTSLILIVLRNLTNGIEKTNNRKTYIGGIDLGE